MLRTAWFLTIVSVAMLLVGGLSAHAGLVSVYSATGTSGVDAAFEGPNGFLQTTYGLPDIIRPSNVSNPGGIQNTVLPQVERAVAQLARNNATGLFLPTSASGIPGVSYPIPGGTASGVWDALTNHGAMGNGTNGGGAVTGSSFTNFNGSTRSVGFTLSRTGNLVAYKADNTTWTSASQTYFGDINALEFRIRSTAGNSESYTGLAYTSGGSTSSLNDISAANGNVTIQLFSGVKGDFTLSGTFNTSGITTAWNTQIKVLAVPEPSTWALGLAGLAGGGYSLWRRRKLA